MAREDRDQPGGERHKRTDRGVKRWLRHEERKRETLERVRALAGGRDAGDGAGPVVLYGVHPVLAALRNPERRCLRLLATENAARRLVEEVPQPPLAPVIVRPADIDALLTPDAVHQGLYLEAAPLPEPDLGAIAPDGLLLVLDQVTDPHNVGAILRSAAAFGVAAVIVTQRHSPSATGVLAKAASGALEHVPLAAVRNLGDALERLGAQGVTRIGLDSDGGVDLGELTARGGLRRPLALVLGAEGKGLRQRTGELCDIVARLDVPGAIRSLNVSNAAAVALYAVSEALKRPG